MYFMVGHRVNYYIFTHWPDYVPCIPLQKGRQIVILKVQSCANWQEISMHRMEGIRNFTEQRFYEEVNYLICANVDMKITWAWRSSPPCLAPPILTSMSLVKKISPMLGLSSPARDQTLVPCIAGQIPNHWTTSEVVPCYVF